MGQELQRTVSGVTKTYRSSIEGSQLFDVEKLDGLSGGAVVNDGSQLLYSKMTFEAKRVLNYPSFPRNPNFFVMLAARPSALSIAQWFAKGFGKLSTLHILSGESIDSVPPADQWEQITENGHLTIGRWHNFFHTSLAAWEQEWHGFPKRGIGAHISFNIEESIFPYLGFYDKTDGPHPLWPTWNSIKDVTTLAEFAGGTKTYQQIRDDGEWTAEMDTRFANRMALSLMVFGQGGAYTGTGFSYWHVEPQTDKLNSEDIFLGEKNMRFWHVPGYSSTNKTITLNGRTYPAPDGHFQKLQTFHDDYKYIIDLSYIKSNTEYNLEPDSRSMQRFLRTRHVTADAIGRDMINMDRMMRNHGKLIANVFQQQHYAEQNLFSPYSWYDASEKIDLPPYIVYSQRTIREFIWSGIPGSGYFGFDNYITDNTMPPG